MRGSSASRLVERAAGPVPAGLPARPARAPVVAGPLSVAFCLANPEINRFGWTWREYLDDPRAMMGLQLEGQRWARLRGLDRSPEPTWSTWVDLDRILDAWHLGCGIVFPDGEAPAPVPILSDRKERLYHLDPPDPLGSRAMTRSIEMFEAVCDAAEGMDLDGASVCPPPLPAGLACGGIMSAAAALRGSMNLCADLVEDPSYADDLLSFVTEAMVARALAARDYLARRGLAGPVLPMPGPGPGAPGYEGLVCAMGEDDAITLVSPDDYRRAVLPHHRRLFAALGVRGGAHIHLCGRVSASLLDILHLELGIVSFGLGHASDPVRVRRELGPTARLRWGPSPWLLRHGSPPAIRQEVLRVIEAPETGRGPFILTMEDNEIAPGTPLENLLACFDAARDPASSSRTSPRHDG